MLEAWYPIPLYYHDNIENPEEILQEIKSVESQIDKLYTPNVWSDNVAATFGTVKNIIINLDLINLNAFLHNHVIRYMGELSLKPSRFFMHDSWFNKMDKFGYQDKHIHYHSTISGCYYYEDSGYIEEGIEFSTVDDFGITKYIKHPFKTNRLILFPGLLEHSVKFKKTDGVRKSISFNFTLDYS